MYCYTDTSSSKFSPHFFRTRNDSAVTLLTISTYNNTRDDGTYVCRTSNIVGDDAAVVVLRTGT